MVALHTYCSKERETWGLLAMGFLIPSLCTQNFSGPAGGGVRTLVLVSLGCPPTCVWCTERSAHLQPPHSRPRFGFRSHPHPYRAMPAPMCSRLHESVTPTFSLMSNLERSHMQRRTRKHSSRCVSRQVLSGDLWKTVRQVRFTGVGKRGN